VSENLWVIADRSIVGRISRAGNRLTFRYEDEWRNSPKAFPVSLSMPLVVSEHSHKAVDAFLWGLLPDNNQVLEQWGKRFHVSPRNAFKLISHVGEDCAGAVQFVAPERIDKLLESPDETTVTWLSGEDLGQRIRLLLENHGITRTGTDTGQFSLAGAQPKTALYRDPATGRWGVPEGRTPTTHILKPSAEHFDGYAENEHFCLCLSREMGLKAAASTVIHADGQPVIVIDRYDRLVRNGHFVRIHQEDFCQALAILPDLKYQNDGGPSAKAIAGVLKDSSSEVMTDLWRFAEALAFNWLIAGTDAHAKNYSLLLAARAQVRLAPLYDLASSLPYPAEVNPHKAKLAMKIGSKYKIKDVVGRHWSACARELGLPPAELLERIGTMASLIPDAATRVADSMEKSGIRHRVIGVLLEELAKHAEGCREKLRAID
jgi:serine/threonine-protein kinase HipA